MPRTPSALRKKGRVNGRKGSGDWEGEHTEAKWKAGKGLAKSNRNGTRIHLLFSDAEETLRQRARQGKKGFLVSWLFESAVRVCLFFFTSSSSQLSQQARKICKKADQFLSPLFSSLFSSPTVCFVFLVWSLEEMVRYA